MENIPERHKNQGFLGFKARFELPRPNPVEQCCRFADSSIFQNTTFFGPGLAKCAKILAMPGSPSRHIGQLRANPFEECCRTRRVNAEGLILAPLGGRKVQNHHASLRKPSKTAKVYFVPLKGNIKGRSPRKGSPYKGPGPGPNKRAQTGPGPK